MGKAIFKYTVGSLFSYAFPRVLIALGLPLDRWIVAVAQISTEAALWVATAAVALVLFFADRLWHWLQNRKNDGETKSPTGPTATTSGTASPAIAAGRDVYYSHPPAPVAPRPAKPPPRCPQMPIWRAIEYVQRVIGDNGYGTSYAETRRRIRQAAKDGAIEVWGKREIMPTSHGSRPRFKDVHSKIERSYWNNHSITDHATQECSDNSTHTAPEEQLMYQRDRYCGLRVDRSEIEAEWPEEAR